MMGGHAVINPGHKKYSGELENAVDNFQTKQPQNE